MHQHKGLCCAFQQLYTNIHANVKRDTVVKLAKKLCPGTCGSKHGGKSGVCNYKTGVCECGKILRHGCEFLRCPSREVQGVGAADMVGVMAKEHAVAIMVDPWNSKGCNWKGCEFMQRPWRLS